MFIETSHFSREPVFWMPVRCSYQLSHWSSGIGAEERWQNTKWLLYLDLARNALVLKMMSPLLLTMQTKVYNKQIQCEKQLCLWPSILCYPLLYMTIYPLLSSAIYDHLSSAILCYDHLSSAPMLQSVTASDWHSDFRRPTSGNFICHQTSGHSQHGGATYLACLVLCNQDVPGRQISVHKRFPCQVLHTWGYILTESKEGMGSVRWYQLSWSDVKWKSL